MLPYGRLLWRLINLAFKWVWFIVSSDCILVHCFSRLHFIVCGLGMSCAVKKVYLSCFFHTAVCARVGVDSWRRILWRIWIWWRASCDGSIASSRRLASFSNNRGGLHSNSTSLWSGPDQSNNVRADVADFLLSFSRFFGWSRGVWVSGGCSLLGIQFYSRLFRYLFYNYFTDGRSVCNWIRLVFELDDAASTPISSRIGRHLIVWLAVRSCQPGATAEEGRGRF